MEESSIHDRILKKLISDLEVDSSMLESESAYYSGLSATNNDVTMTIENVIPLPSSSLILFTLEGGTSQAIDYIKKIDESRHLSSDGYTYYHPVKIVFDSKTQKAYGYTTSQLVLDQIPFGIDLRLLNVDDYSIYWEVSMPRGEEHTWQTSNVAVDQEVKLGQNTLYIDNLILYPDKSVLKLLYYGELSPVPKDLLEINSTDSKAVAAAKRYQRIKATLMSRLFLEIRHSITDEVMKASTFLKDSTKNHSESSASFFPIYQPGELLVKAFTRTWAQSFELKPFAGENVTTSNGEVIVESTNVKKNGEVQIELNCGVNTWDSYHISFKNAKTGEYIIPTDRALSLNFTKWTFADISLDELIIVVDSTKIVDEVEFTIAVPSK